MKDSYDQLDWQNGESAQGYTHYSKDDYDSFAKNPTYRSDFYEEQTADTYQDSYDQSYDNGYQDGYDQSYDNSYQDGYDQTYYNDQQTDTGFSDPQFAPPPTQYSQADYDRFAQNPTYHNENYANKMGDEQFFDMIHQQNVREKRRDLISDIAVSGTPLWRLNSHYGEGGGDLFTKDTLLFLLFCGFGAALAKLFGLPLWAYPMFAGIVAYAVSIIKKIFIENNEPKAAFKESIIEGAIAVIGLIASIVLYAKGI